MHNTLKHDMRQVSFRVPQDEYDEFTDLLAKVPGSDTGAMYREVFRRGLQHVQAFYEKHLDLTCEEIAAEMGVDHE